MLENFNYFSYCKTLLLRRSHCELVMLSENKNPLFANLTDDEFMELKHLAMRNLIRGCEIDDLDETWNKLRGDYNE